MEVLPAMPRRLLGSEERELLDAVARLRSSEEQVDRHRQERDHLIRDLLDDGVRLVDIADTVGLTPRATREAAKRAP